MNEERIPEKSMRSEYIYSGRIIKLRKDIVILPDGNMARREIIEHPGAVVILAENEQQDIILVKQFRKAVEEFLLELPAGTVEPSEKLLACAKRELEEETGYIARNWQKVFDFYSAPGFCSERLTLYYARNLMKTKSDTDQDEFIELIEVNKEQVKLLIEQKKIRDAKSLVGIFWWLYK